MGVWAGSVECETSTYNAVAQRRLGDDSKLGPTSQHVAIGKIHALLVEWCEYRCGPVRTRK